MQMLRGDRELTGTLIANGSVDLSYSIPQKTRFRVNIFSQRGTYAIVLRAIPEGIPTLAALKMPAELFNVPALKNGIVLVTGPTGLGSRPRWRRSSTRSTRSKPTTSSPSRTRSSTSTATPSRR